MKDGILRFHKCQLRLTSEGHQEAAFPWEIWPQNLKLLHSISLVKAEDQVQVGGGRNFTPDRNREHSGSECETRNIFMITSRICFISHALSHHYSLILVLYS